MIKPIKRTTLYENIAKQIITLIKEGKWAPGDKLSGETELANSFQVSRNSVRESLKALELMGIVKSMPGRGTYLSPDVMRNINKIELLWLFKNEGMLKELMEARLIIEVELTYLAAKRANQDDIEKLASIIKKSVDAVEAKCYSRDIGLEFHMTIAHIARNSILNNFLNSITDELAAERNLIKMKYADETILREVREHKQLFNYIKEHEASKARDLMYRHISYALKILV
ncbi:MAG: hypothetical protein HPY66_2470 [Firmicutes bacterium]|nr:hypothetical protein [Bacillota bacterium]